MNGILGLAMAAAVGMAATAATTGKDGVKVLKVKPGETRTIHVETPAGEETHEVVIQRAPGEAAGETRVVLRKDGQPTRVWRVAGGDGGKAIFEVGGNAKVRTGGDESPDAVVIEGEWARFARPKGASAFAKVPQVFAVGEGGSPFAFEFPSHFPFDSEEEEEELAELESDLEEELADLHEDMADLHEDLLDEVHDAIEEAVEVEWEDLEDVEDVLEEIDVDTIVAERLAALDIDRIVREAMADAGVHGLLLDHFAGEQDEHVRRKVEAARARAHAAHDRAKVKFVELLARGGSQEECEEECEAECEEKCAAACEAACDEAGEGHGAAVSHLHRALAAHARAAGAAAHDAAAKARHAASLERERALVERERAQRGGRGQEEVLELIDELRSEVRELRQQVQDLKRQMRGSGIRVF